MGVITDWSDTQLNGLQAAVGDMVASKVVKGCKVCLTLSCMLQHSLNMHAPTHVSATRCTINGQ